MQARAPIEVLEINHQIKYQSEKHASKSQCEIEITIKTNSSEKLISEIEILKPIAEINFIREIDFKNQFPTWGENKTTHNAEYKANQAKKNERINKTTRKITKFINFKRNIKENVKKMISHD